MKKFNVFTVLAITIALFSAMVTPALGTETNISIMFGKDCTEIGACLNQYRYVKCSDYLDDLQNLTEYYNCMNNNRL